MGVFKSLKNFCGTIANVFSAKVDQANKDIQDNNIVPLAESSVEALNDQIIKGIESCAEIRTKVASLKNQREVINKKLSQVVADYERAIIDTKALIKSNESTDKIKIEETKINNLYRIKINYENELTFIEKTIKTLIERADKLENDLTIMRSNLSVIKCRLNTEITRKNCNDIQKNVVEKINGCINNNTIDGIPHLNRLEEINTYDENVMEIKQTVFGEECTGTTNSNELPEEVKQALYGDDNTINK